jgi:hypothetical protein
LTKNTGWPKITLTQKFLYSPKRKLRKITTILCPREFFCVNVIVGHHVTSKKMLHKKSINQSSPKSTKINKTQKNPKKALKTRPKKITLKTPKIPFNAEINPFLIFSIEMSRPPKN